jgi:hypothetical protein
MTARSAARARTGDSTPRSPTLADELGGDCEHVVRRHERRLSVASELEITPRAGVGIVFRHEN